jgi:hypothetical protein
LPLWDTQARRRTWRRITPPYWGMPSKWETSPCSRTWRWGGVLREYMVLHTIYPLHLTIVRAYIH